MPPTVKPTLRVTVASSASLNIVWLLVSILSSPTLPPSSRVPPDRSRLEVPKSSEVVLFVISVPVTV